MRTCRSIFSVFVVALLILVPLTTRADVAVVSRTISVPIIGTVAGQTEGVALAGTIEIASLLVTDTSGSTPK